MKAEGMTIRGIAELCGVGETTVRRWADEASAKMAEISAKMAEAKETSKAAEFSLDETLAIIRAGGRGLTADLLEANARAGLPAPKPQPILSGAQYRELRFMVRDKILSPLMVQKVLGVAPATGQGPASPAQLEAPASAAQGEAAFAEILRRLDSRPGLPPKTVERVVAAAAGATRSTLRKIEREQAAAGQGGLFV